MKKLFVYSVVAVSMLINADCFASPVSEFEKQGMQTNEQKRAGFVIEEASKTIAQHLDLLTFMYKEAGTDTVWFQVIGEQLLYQPTAVIALMAQADVPVEKMCPRVPYRGTYEHVIEDWLKRSVIELNAFTLKEAKAEAIRKACLERNQKALADILATRSY